MVILFARLPRGKGGGDLMKTNVLIGAGPSNELNKKPKEFSNSEKQQDNEKKKFNILIADDGVGARDMLYWELKSEGYNVTKVDDGDKAIEKSKETFFHLAILDIKMPRVDGLEAYKRIKEIHPETEIVLITAYSTDKLALEAIENGIHVIAKPIDPDEFLNACKEICEKKMKVLNYANP